jgi:8-oxo-dGTP diphosphatase
MRRRSSGRGTAIREFGKSEPGVNYVLRPGGYAVIFNDAGEVALVKTPLGFALSGGGQNEGETPEQAAIREAHEECGLIIALRHRIGVADELVFAADERTHYRKSCTFFLAKVVEATGTGEKDHELHWLPATDAAGTLLHGSQQWAVAEACCMTDTI